MNVFWLVGCWLVVEQMIYVVSSYNVFLHVDECFVLFVSFFMHNWCFFLHNPPFLRKLCVLYDLFGVYRVCCIALFFWGCGLNLYVCFELHRRINMV